jgi:hypothetical protein
MHERSMLFYESSNQSKVALMRERFTPPFVDYLIFFIPSEHACKNWPIQAF